MNVAAVLEEPRAAGQVALIYRDEPVTYDELHDLVVRVHAALVALGVGPGDRVLLAAASTTHYVASLFGVMRSGALVVPVNPLAPAPELQTEIDAVTPAAVLVGPAAQAAMGECRIDAPVIALPGAVLDGALAFDDFIAAGAPDAPPVHEVTNTDVGLLLFTSGTAGAPKPAMLTHRNLLANIEQLRAASDQFLGAGDVVLGAIPLFHIQGLNLLLGMLSRGGAVVLMERFDAAQSVGLIARHHITAVSGPPTMWQAWADLPDVDAGAFASIRLPVSGAAPLTADVAARIEERLGVRLRQGYGLTEAAPTLTVAIGTEAPVTSVGRPLPGVELRLVDAAGDDVPVGDVGEVWARGENIFPGYWNDPAATAEALTPDGWLRTGDLGVVDDEGFVYLVNRQKDLIVVSGFNVFPGEVEQALRAHESVAEAAVVGTPHPSTGESVKAVVVARPGAHIDEHELIDHCLARLARYKCPTVVEVVAALPTGLVGKIRRRELR